MIDRTWKRWISTAFAGAALVVAQANCSGGDDTNNLVDNGDASPTGNDGATVTCTGATTQCASGCVDMTSDVANCGACGKACTSGQVCTAGACAATCGAGTTACGSSCVDMMESPANCGACGNACGTGSACVAGKCLGTCLTGQLACGADGCVDPTASAKHCGAKTDCKGTNAGTACPDGQVCGMGVCALKCPQNQVACNGACVDPKNNPLFCGAASNCSGANTGTVCKDGKVCGNGACAVACPATQLNCGGKCIDPKVDPLFCNASADCAGGNKGISCNVANGEVCAQGACALSCPTGTVGCNGSCVDPMINPAFCGAKSDCSVANETSGSVCDASKQEVCVAGACVSGCPLATPKFCANSKTCANVTNDANNCGDCGHVCGGGQCVNSACTCAQGQVLSAGSCAFPVDCTDLHAQSPSLTSGAFFIDPDGLGGPIAPFQAFCDMSTNGGGWTLALKADGTDGARFGFAATTWTASSTGDANFTFNTTSTDLTQNSAKFMAFNVSSADELMLGFQQGNGAMKTLMFPIPSTDNDGQTPSTLQKLFASNEQIPLVAPTRDDFLGLMTPDTQHLEPNCNFAAINAQNWFRTRIGLIANNENDCNTPDSMIGVGNDTGAGGCNPALAAVGSMGNCATSTPGGDGSSTAFAFVFVRRIVPAKSCADLLAAGHTVSGAFNLDFDGPDGPIAPERVFCDMDTTHDGGGWAMIAKISGGATSPTADAFGLFNSGAGSNFSHADHLSPLWGTDMYFSQAAATDWKGMGISKVRVAAYTTRSGGSSQQTGVAQEVLTMHFNNRTTDDQDSWFSYDTLDQTVKNGPVANAWTDLASGAPFGGGGDDFSALGENNNPNARRRFFINQKYGGCPSDTGWFAITGADDGGSVTCSWDGDSHGSGYNDNNGARIVYNNAPTAQDWTSSGSVSVADTFAVFVK